MTRTEYMECLKKRLRHLPKKDFINALDYFEEYFEEAGGENEQQAIEDLGDPVSAGNQIIRNLAISKAKEPEKGILNGINAVWIGILAVCAAPIALPVVLILLVAVISVILTVVVLLGITLALSVMMLVASPFTIAAGASLVTSDPAGGIYTLGSGLVMLSGSILFIIITGFLVKWLFIGISKLFGRIVKGGKKHEKN